MAMHEFSNIKEMANFMSNVISMSRFYDYERTKENTGSRSITQVVHRSYTVRILIDTVYTVRTSTAQFIHCMHCMALHALPMVLCTRNI